jgi:hypothetical protein
MKRSGKGDRRGTLYSDVSLRLFDSNADASDRVEVVTLLGDVNGLWTRLKGGDGMFRLFPLLEQPGAADGNGYISPLPAPLRSKRRAPRLDDPSIVDCTRILPDSPPPAPVILDIVTRLVPGIKIARDSISLLKSFSMRVKGKKKKKRGTKGQGSHSAVTAAPVDIEKVTERHAVLEEYIRNVWALSAKARKEAESEMRALVDTDKKEEEELRATTAPQSTQDEEDADAADTERVCNRSASFRGLVYDGGIKLLLHSITTAKDDAEETFKVMRSVEAGDVVMEQLGRPASEAGVRRAHLLGEAFEVYAAHALTQREEFVLKDYLTPDPLSHDCVVYRCFRSGALEETPFHMTTEDSEDLKSALKTQAEDCNCPAENGVKLAEHLIGHMRKDRAFDILVWLRDTKDNRNHFLAVQCKARTRSNASVNAQKYLLNATDMQLCAAKLQCLTPLMWYSNVSTSRAITRERLTTMTADSGRVIPWLLPDLCQEGMSDELMRRVAVSVESKTLSIDRVPIRPLTLWSHQIKAVTALAKARNKGIVYGVAELATGAGKVDQLHLPLLGCNAMISNIALLLHRKNWPTIDCPYPLLYPFRPMLLVRTPFEQRQRAT